MGASATVSRGGRAVGRDGGRAVTRGGRPVGRTGGRAIGRSGGRAVCRPVGWSVRRPSGGLSFGPAERQSIGRAVGRGGAGRSGAAAHKRAAGVTGAACRCVCVWGHAVHAVLLEQRSGVDLGGSGKRAQSPSRRGRHKRGSKLRLRPKKHRLEQHAGARSAQDNNIRLRHIEQRRLHRCSPEPETSGQILGRPQDFGSIFPTRLLDLLY